jgi:hypothetical protein
MTFLRLYKGDIKFTLGAAQRMVELLERYFSMSGSGAICAWIQFYSDNSWHLSEILVIV